MYRADIVILQFKVRVYVVIYIPTNKIQIKSSSLGGI